MGLIPKYKREKQKLIRREAKAAKKRGEKVRSKIVRFLIVCEGSETEPNYFESFIADNYSQVLSPIVKGGGRSTCSLVKWAKDKKDELERASQLRFDRVWVVFDKDDNNDFDTAISRTACIEKLEGKIRECKGYKTYRYEKNSKKMYDIITSLGNEKSTISYARHLRSTYSKEQKFSEHNPCTTVDRLIEELRGPEKFL